jgi:surface protein
MSTSRPFAYNNGSPIVPIPGTIQLGSLAIGTPTAGFASTGLEWWMGPDENLGYIIARPVPDDSQPTPVSGVTASVAFIRTSDLTDVSFIALVNSYFNQSFTTVGLCLGWLSVNGYWTSYGAGIFTTTWATTTPSESITLPYLVGGTYSGTIDWGDGNTSANSYDNRTHQYTTAGTYTVVINGTCTGWNFGVVADSKLKIKSVVQWGQLRFGNNQGVYFYECANLDLSSVSDVLDLTGVVILEGMFWECLSLTTINNINSWNTSAITDMSFMFWGCAAFNQPLSFNTAAVTDMEAMFLGCTSLNSALTFNTSAVTNMDTMLGSCEVFNQPLTFTSTALVTTMQSMFINCHVFNQPIGSWNTEAVTDMSFMFASCYVFNQPIGTWDTEAVTDMNHMFHTATAFNQNIGAWNVGNVTNFVDFMVTKTNATFSTANLDAIYNGWIASPKTVQSGITISFGSADYTAAGAVGKGYLTGIKSWTIQDGIEV